MLSLLIVVALVSLLLALWSLRDYDEKKQTDLIKAKIAREQIKGGIVIESGKKSKHYSSYS